MSRFINADVFEVFGYTSQDGTFDDGVQFVLEKIDEQPTADVVEHKRGEWIQHVNEPSLWSCSICESVIYSEHEEDRLKFHKWCGCCGADMRESEEEDG